MKILIIPLIVVLLPLVTLMIFFKYRKNNQISTYTKIITLFFYFAVSIVASLFATFISINGIGEKGIACATGAVVFIPIGIFTTAIGILLIFLPKEKMTNNC